MTLEDSLKEMSDTQRELFIERTKDGGCGELDLAFLAEIMVLKGILGFYNAIEHKHKVVEAKIE